MVERLSENTRPRLKIQLHPLQHGGSVAPGVCEQCDGRGMVEFCDVYTGLPDQQLAPAHLIRMLHNGEIAELAHGSYRSAKACECRKRNRSARKAEERADHLRASKTWATWDANKTEFLLQDGDAARSVVFTKLANWQHDRWIYFWGDHGCGKTHVLYAMAKKAIDSGIAALFVNLKELLGEQKRAYRTNSNATPLDNAVAAPLLFVDDMGVDRLTTWHAESLYDLIDRRLRAERTTVFASNFSFRRLQSYLTTPFGVVGPEAAHIAQNGARLFTRISSTCETYELRSKVRR